MDTITLQLDLPVSAEVAYAAWLDSGKHSAMTGGEAEISDQVDEAFEAWNGYITGSNFELDPHKRIVQKWRTTEFDESDQDSDLELLFEDTDIGCTITLNHAQLPEGTVEKYAIGWQEHYFEPMEEYFSSEE